MSPRMGRVRRVQAPTRASQDPFLAPSPGQGRYFGIPWRPLIPEVFRAMSHRSRTQSPDEMTTPLGRFRWLTKAWRRDNEEASVQRWSRALLQALRGGLDFGVQRSPAALLALPRKSVSGHGSGHEIALRPNLRGNLLVRSPSHIPPVCHRGVRKLVVMELGDEQSRTTLAYLAALDAHSYTPTVDELQAYATNPSRRGAVLSGGIFDTTVGSTMASIANVFKGTRVDVPAETVTDYLLRLGWATLEDERVRITTLGRAVCKVLQQTTDTEDAVVVLQPNDPIALGRVVEHFAKAGDALLVDPYFRLDQLTLIVGRTVLTRVLTSERVTEAELAGLQTAVEQLLLPRAFEVRVASRELHDRYLIPPSGPITLLGSSMNSIGRVVTAMTPLSDGAEDLRQTYENLWDGSRVLASAHRLDEESG